jgi:dynein heavy chain
MFMFNGDKINLVPTCGIFITMNPGYAGRTELPDNLKSLFRAISMMVPDTKLIAEIMLFGEGFRDTRNLANKVYVLFVLCRQQLSKQDHYEFGLRGLVALLRYAGQCRRQNSKMPDNEVPTRASVAEIVKTNAFDGNTLFAHTSQCRHIVRRSFRDLWGGKYFKY